MPIARVALQGGIRREVLIAVEDEPMAPIAGRARSRDDIDGGIAREPGGGVEVDGGELKLLHRVLRNLDPGADRADETGVAAVNGDAGEADARSRLQAGAQRRD